MRNVYPRFLKDFGNKAKPLNALLRAEDPPDLRTPTDAQIVSFEDLRKALLCFPVLALPKANRKLVVDVDACADQFGCTLLHEEPGELLHPVGYWSRGLFAAEQKYSTTERECLGVVWAVLKLRHFLDGTTVPHPNGSPGSKLYLQHNRFKRTLDAVATSPLRIQIRNGIQTGCIAPLARLPVTCLHCGNDRRYPRRYPFPGFGRDGQQLDDGEVNGYRHT